MRTAPMLGVILLITPLLAGGCAEFWVDFLGFPRIHRSEGEYYPLHPVAPAVKPLAGYTQFELAPFADGTGGAVPLQFLGRFHKEFYDEVDGAGARRRPGEKRAIVRGVITRYGYEVIARVEIVDAETDALLAAADCTGYTGEPRYRRAIRKRAEGLAEAIADWIDSMHPGKD